MSMNDLSQNDHFMTDDSQDKALYPIREVSRLTGINPITLRAWERRYELLEPIRTESGHRLYSSDHIHLLQKAVKLVNEQGIPISQVKQLLEADAQASIPTISAASTTSDPESLTNLLKQAVHQANRHAIHQLIGKVVSDLPFSISARLLLDTYLQLREELTDDALNTHVGVLLFNTLLEQKLQLRLYYLQQTFNPAKPTLLVQNTLAEYPNWLSGLVAHFIGEQNYNVQTLSTWLAPENLLASIKKLDCSGVCLVDPINDSQGISLWQPWTKKHATLNNWLFGPSSIKQSELDFGECRVRALTDWFKPLR